MRSSSEFINKLGGALGYEVKPEYQPKLASAPHGDEDGRIGWDTMSKFPRGKLSADDEGETDMAITVRDRTVIVAFTKPMRWIGMDKETALGIGRKLIERANEIKD